MEGLDGDMGTEVDGGRRSTPIRTVIHHVVAYPASKRHPQDLQRTPHTPCRYTCRDVGSKAPPMAPDQF